MVSAQERGVVLGPKQSALPEVNAGELLLGELSCTACHSADASLLARLGDRKPPNVGADGLHLTPQYLRAFLDQPNAAKPGTVMPDVLHGLSGKKRADTVDALVHFLASINTSALSTNSSGEPAKVVRGRDLFHTIGCVACHAPEIAKEGASPADLGRLQTESFPLSGLARKFTVEDLTRFLLDPVKFRPAGRMPSFNLTEKDANTLAVYLLRDQAPSMSNRTLATRKVPGLIYQYLEAPQIQQTSQLDALTPIDEGVTDRPQVPAKHRKENFGFRFFGSIQITNAGSYTFFTTSDDGSVLLVDGKMVVNNDRDHAAQQAKGTVTLTAGDHDLVILYYNAGGDGELRVAWQPPGANNRQPLPPTVLFHVEHPMTPLGAEDFAVDAIKAARGKEFFSTLGCGSCHGDVPSTTPAAFAKIRPLLSVNPTKGCLADKPPKDAAQFRLSNEQRQALRTTLKNRTAIAGARNSKQEVAYTLTRLNCIACHTRGGVGGPSPTRSAYFTSIGEADLGDEGRLPPHLNSPGNKLRAEWLREVLEKGGTARPYMATRMPQFGAANVDHLVDAFAQADGPLKNESAPETADAKIGRKLVGTGGMSCISCHTFAGHKSLGIPAMDLALIGKRLREDWFERYLLNPVSLRPGTRMPAFWPEGKSTRPEILGGDTHRQINAIWAYLSAGKDAWLPDGLIQGKVELVADKEAVIYRNFLSGVTRAIGVGYPEKANLIWDANDLRLVSIWQGSFIDAGRHQEGRGEGFVNPLGFNIVTMPQKAPFAELANPNDPWPSRSGKAAGFQMKGYTLDSVRRPAFNYTFDGIAVTDYPVAVAGETDSTFRRTLTLRGTASNLWFRAWVGSSVEAKPDGTYLIDGKVKMKFELSGNSKPVIRQSEGRTELLVPVKFPGDLAKIVQTIVW